MESVSAAPRPAPSRTRECDFCGRQVHRGISVERVEKTAGVPEVIVLCVDCAVGAD